MMFPSVEKVDQLSDCDSSHGSNSSETPSEIEARLFSVLHYHDFSQPLPSDIAAEYSVSFSGTEVCVTATKNPRHNNKIMAKNQDNFASAQPSSTDSGLRSSSQIGVVSEPCNKAVPSKGKLKAESNHSQQSKNKSSDNVEDLEAPSKRRKLDTTEEDKCTDSSNDVNAGKKFIQDLLLKYDPQTNVEQTLLTLFKKFSRFFVKCSRDKKKIANFNKNKPKFKTLFRMYQNTVKCSDALLFDLVRDSFKELYAFLHDSWKTLPKKNERLDRHVSTNQKIAQLVQETLLCFADGSSEEPTMGSRRNQKEETISPGPKRISIIDEDDDDCVVISDDDSCNVKVVDCKYEQARSSSKSGKNPADVWINAPSTSKLDLSSSQDHSSLSEDEGLIDDSEDESVIGDSKDEGLQNGYSSSCPPSWSEDMINYYCKSWGGETFNHVDILKELKAKTKPSEWRVTSHLDLIPPYKRQRGRQCNRCLQWGHLQYQCREPIKPVICLMCGGQNHIQSYCVDSKCLNCGTRRKQFSDDCSSCSNLSTSKRRKCVICESDNHDHTVCPDTWRSYHLTVSGNVATPSDSQANPRQYCCNCGRAGHLDYSCPALKKGNKVNNPFVSNYDFEKLNLFRPKPSVETLEMRVNESTGRMHESFSNGSQERYFQRSKGRPEKPRSHEFPRKHRERLHAPKFSKQHVPEFNSKQHESPTNSLEYRPHRPLSQQQKPQKRPYSLLDLATLVCSKKKKQRFN